MWAEVVKPEKRFEDYSVSVRGKINEFSLAS